MNNFAASRQKRKYEETFTSNIDQQRQGERMVKTRRCHMWESMYRHLVTYHHSHGNTLVPRSYEVQEGKVKLGRWVDKQRQRKESMSMDRQEKLNSIGFVWSLQPAWEEMYERLVSYKAKHGHCLVPQKYNEDSKLGLWVANQRKMTREKRKLNASRIQKLNAIGFIWYPQRHLPAVPALPLQPVVDDDATPAPSPVPAAAAATTTSSAPLTTSNSSCSSMMKNLNNFSNIMISSNCYPSSLSSVSAASNSKNGLLSTLERAQGFLAKTVSSLDSIDVNKEEDLLVGSSSINLMQQPFAVPAFALNSLACSALSPTTRNYLEPKQSNAMAIPCIVPSVSLGLGPVVKVTDPTTTTSSFGTANMPFPGAAAAGPAAPSTTMAPLSSQEKNDGPISVSAASPLYGDNIMATNCCSKNDNDDEILFKTLMESTDETYDRLLSSSTIAL